MTAPQVTPQRNLIQREPVRVANAVFTFLAAINAILLGAGAYSGGVAAAVTGIIAASAAFVGELVRSDTVAYKPLQDLHEADLAAAAQTPNTPPPG